MVVHVYIQLTQSFKVDSLTNNCRGSIGVCVYIYIPRLKMGCDETLCNVAFLPFTSHPPTSQVSTSHERSLQKARQTVTGYCREVEALLSLLSLCLRTVHEAEMVARQFTRSDRKDSENTLLLWSLKFR